MALTLFRGKYHIEYFPKQASTAFAKNSLVAIGGTSGTIKPATSSTTEHLGIIKTKIAATDSDYASTTLVPVLIPDLNSSFLADGTGFDSTDVGVKVDLTDASNVNASATSVKSMLVVGIISSTKGIVKIVQPQTSNA